MNYTVVDTLDILKASLALAPILFAPGYVAGWALNLFEFRQRRLLLRFVLALPLSIAICPIISYLLARFLPLALWAFYLSSIVGCLILIANDVRRAKAATLPKYSWTALAMSLAWVAGAMILLVDMQLGNRLYQPLAAYDHATRIAMMEAIARHVPPNNPFFAHPSVPLRYHYLWMLLCSLPMKAFHLSARSLMSAGIVWCGLGLFCVISLGLKFLLQCQTATARKTLLAIALLCITGLDILPILFLAASHGTWLADMEWWNTVPIASWAASLLWVPHDVAALIACFVGFLLLRHQVETDGKFRIVPVIVAGIAFAGAAGLAIYVTFTFVVAIAFWLMTLVARKNWNEAAMFFASGVVSLLCAFPYLASLGGPGAGSAFVELALRPFFFAPNSNGAIQTPLSLIIANAVVLPINYAVELGFFLAVGLLRLRRLSRGDVSASTNELAAWTLVGASFVVGSFLRSSTITTNDLGIRCFLPAQLILLLWGATLVHDWWFAGAAQAASPLRAHFAFWLLLILGATGTAYQVFMLRMSPFLYDRWGVAGIDWMDRDWHLGERNRDLRSLYEALSVQLGPAATIQHNPTTRNFIPHGLYSGHDAVAGSVDCGIAFGGDPRACEQRVRRLKALFSDLDNPESVCKDYGIDVLVAEDTDSVWRDSSSWVWSQTPLVANDRARAFRCNEATPDKSRR